MAANDLMLSDIRVEFLYSLSLNQTAKAALFIEGVLVCGYRRLCRTA
jgi:hypothetical protein